MHMLTCVVFGMKYIELVFLVAFIELFRMHACMPVLIEAELRYRITVTSK
jgi:hypothetical protein